MYICLLLSNTSSFDNRNLVGDGCSFDDEGMHLNQLLKHTLNLHSVGRRPCKGAIVFMGGLFLHEMDDCIFKSIQG